MIYLIHVLHRLPLWDDFADFNGRRLRLPSLGLKPKSGARFVEQPVVPSFRASGGHWPETRQGRTTTRGTRAKRAATARSPQLGSKVKFRSTLNPLNLNLCPQTPAQPSQNQIPYLQNPFQNPHSNHAKTPKNLLEHP